MLIIVVIEILANNFYFLPACSSSTRSTAELRKATLLSFPRPLRTLLWPQGDFMLGSRPTPKSSWVSYSTQWMKRWVIVSVSIHMIRIIIHFSLSVILTFSFILNTRMFLYDFCFISFENLFRISNLFFLLHEFSWIISFLRFSNSINFCINLSRIFLFSTANMGTISNLSLFCSSPCQMELNALFDALLAVKQNLFCYNLLARLRSWETVSWRCRCRWKESLLSQKQ